MAFFVDLAPQRPRFYCSRHMHGNFVMQKIIQVLPTSALTFILAELKDGSRCAVSIWRLIVCSPPSTSLLP